MEIAISISNFIKSAPTRAENQCPDCLSDIEYLDGVFWLQGTEAKWEIALPFCSRCKPEVLLDEPVRMQ